MNAECRIESDGTIFRFYVTDKGVADGGYYWTDAVISVENWCFNYKTSASCIEFSELKGMRDKLSALLNDEIAAVETVEFIEPDVKIILKPKRDLRNEDKYTYIKEGYEIEDISADYLLFPFLDGVMTEQHYVMPLYRENIKLLVEYLDEMITKWDTPI
jgi:hypothetical protein